MITPPRRHLKQARRSSLVKMRLLRFINQWHRRRHRRRQHCQWTQPVLEPRATTSLHSTPRHTCTSHSQTLAYAPSPKKVITVSRSICQSSPPAMSLSGAGEPVLWHQNVLVPTNRINSPYPSGAVPYTHVGPVVPPALCEAHVPDLVVLPSTYPCQAISPTPCLASAAGQSETFRVLTQPFQPPVVNADAGRHRYPTVR